MCFHVGWWSVIIFTALHMGPKLIIDQAQYCVVLHTMIYVIRSCIWYPLNVSLCSYQFVIWLVSFVGYILSYVLPRIWPPVTDMHHHSLVRDPLTIDSEHMCFHLSIFRYFVSERVVIINFSSWPGTLHLGQRTHRATPRLTEKQNPGGMGWFPAPSLRQARRDSLDWRQVPVSLFIWIPV